MTHLLYFYFSKQITDYTLSWSYVNQLCPRHAHIYLPNKNIATPFGILPSNFSFRQAAIINDRFLSMEGRRFHKFNNNNKQSDAIMSILSATNFKGQYITSTVSRPRRLRQKCNRLGVFSTRFLRIDQFLERRITHYVIIIIITY